MKKVKKWLAGLFIGVMVAGSALTVSAADFTDVKEGAWYEKYVNAVSEEGLMTGVEEGVFGVDGNIKREQLVQTLYAKEGKPKVEYTDTFSDVSEGAWYADAVLWAAENGITAGKGDNKFGVDDDITRQELATMLKSYAKYKEYDVTTTADLSGYPDVDDVASWAEAPLQWAVTNEIISGQTASDGETIMLNPEGTATREMYACMLTKFLMAFEDYELDSDDDNNNDNNDDDVDDNKFELPFVVSSSDDSLKNSYNVWDVVFNVADFYEDYDEEGDDITIKVTVSSESGFGGIIGITSDGTWKASEEFIGSGTWKAAFESATGDAHVQFYWMNGDSVTITAIEVYATEDEPVSTAYGYNAIIEAEGTTYLSEAIELVGSSWDSKWIKGWNDDVTENYYFVVSYKGTAPYMVLQAENGNEGWCQTKPCYDDGSVAVYSYKAMEEGYSGTGELYGVQVQAAGADVTVSSIKLVEYANLAADYEAIIEAQGETYITESVELVGSAYGAKWVSGWNEDAGDDHYFVVNYTGTTPLIVIQGADAWCQASAIYDNGSSAVYSYKLINAAYTGEKDATGIQVQANGSDVTVKEVKLVKYTK